MADIVKYRGCSIIIHTGVTMDGRTLGSYEIVADSVETAAAFATRGLCQLRTLIDPHEESGGAPRVDRQYLVEMAKCEIDFVLEIDF
jgi:hypothetical protein